MHTLVKRDILERMTNRKILILFSTLIAGVFLLARHRSTSTIDPESLRNSEGDQVEIATNEDSSGDVDSGSDAEPKTDSHQPSVSSSTATAAGSTSVSSSPSAGGGHVYIEVFKGLETKKMYYGDEDPEEYDRRQKRYREEPGSLVYDKRLMRLLDIQNGQGFTRVENSASRNLLRIFRETNQSEVAFVNTKQIAVAEIANAEFDMPICIVRFYREGKVRYVDTGTILDFDRSEVVELAPGIKGIRVNVLPDPTGDTASWIKAFECYVRETNPKEERFRQLAIIHLLATLGFEGSRF